ncbi:MAG: SpoIIE family protein phosphatase [Chloroflexi bacterium]|nr:SpoIIE family protein phosphatase [Anaerolineaceae bacterium]NMB88855.1 SpoIIE family protein phosphatase [Chloroflexota bacterium]
MSDSATLRVILTSDQAIFLRGLASVLLSTPAVQLVGEARSSTEALQLCQMTEPDLILLDLRTTLEHRHDVAQQIHQRWPRMQVMIWVSHQEDFQPLEEKRTNDLSLIYISRDVSEEEFKTALEQACCPGRSKAQRAGGHASVVRHHAEEDQVEESFPSRRNEEVLTRELVMAGKIQTDILPELPPRLPGWEITARLEPARETSGDFYDFIPLTDRKLGIVAADVTDKGIGAALFMALSSTLIRTYAARFPTLPGLTMSAVSERILSDTRGSMFVTAFYGILEPFTGRFVYANAGHPPGFLIRTQRGKESVDRLTPTGMALGVSEEARWKQKIAKLSPGDFLVLYTDGITEAQNPAGQFIEEDDLLDILLSKSGCKAHEIEDAILDYVHQFVGSSPRQDDIALLVIRRLP